MGKPIVIVCVTRVWLVSLLTLTAGALAQFSYETNGNAISITGYSGSGGAVIIPATLNGLTVNDIAGGAFYEATNPTSITIPSSVTNIGFGAFEGCGNLTAINVDTKNSFYSSVNGVLFNKEQTTLIKCPMRKSGVYKIPDTVTSIGSYAIDFCSNLTSVTLPQRLASIGDSAFSYCAGLTRITIPSSVTNIAGDVFGGCGSLTRIDVDPQNTVYSSVAGVLFNKRQTTLIEYPGGRRGDYTIPNTVTNVWYHAFAECNLLTNVVVPDSVANIMSWAFQDCQNLTSVAIGSGVTNIDMAFRRCPNLKGVYFQGNAPTVESQTFDGNDKAVIYYKLGTTGWGETFSGRPTVESPLPRR